MRRPAASVSKPVTRHASARSISFTTSGCPPRRRNGSACPRKRSSRASASRPAPPAPVGRVAARRRVVRELHRAIDLACGRLDERGRQAFAVCQRRCAQQYRDQSPLRLRQPDRQPFPAPCHPVQPHRGLFHSARWGAVPGDEQVVPGDHRRVRQGGSGARHPACRPPARSGPRA